MSHNGLMTPGAFLGDPEYHALLFVGVKPTRIETQCQADSHDAHGAPLGADEAEATRKQPGRTLRGLVLIVPCEALSQIWQEDTGHGLKQ